MNRQGSRRKAVALMEDTMTGTLRNSGQASPGALRAADKILEAVEGSRSREVKDLRPATVKILAKIIDREMNTEPRSTAAPDLLIACEEAAKLYDHLAMSPLESAVKYGDNYEPPTDDDILAIRSTIETAITKAKGESQ